MFRKYITSYVG